MKTLTFTLLTVLMLMACNTQKSLSEADHAQESAVENTDSTEYDLIVLDVGFNAFLATQPYSKSYYSDQYYQNLNSRYCIEWNIRHANPMRYGDFYETQIPYDTSIDYGIDFNFKLYQYFQFVEKEYGIVLVRRRGY